MKRTTVFADEDDLAIIKAAAARRGVPEAEVLREAIHLIALGERRWAEPFFTHTYPAADGSSRQADETLESVWADKADAYERAKKSPA